MIAYDIASAFSPHVVVQGFLFSDIGETELRGFEDPVKLWELRWQEDD